MSRPLVVQTEDLDPAAVAWLARHCEIARAAPEAPEAERLARADGLVVRTYTRVDEALLARAPNLRVVGRAGVGLDSIDLEACRRRRVRVVYTPDANGDAVAELVFAMIFDCIRPRVVLDRALPLTEWSRLRRELVASRQLSELTVGVYGLGRIGKRIARIAGAFRARVIYHDLLEMPEAVRHGATPASRERILAESDILTVHIDNRPGNRHHFNDAAFRAMRPDVLFINASRGFVVDHEALARFLRVNPAARAVLDVHDPEPFGPDYPLLGLPNARLTPHIAAATARAHANMSWVVRDVWRVLSGAAPENAAV